VSAGGGLLGRGVSTARLASLGAALNKLPVASVKGEGKFNSASFFSIFFFDGRNHDQLPAVSRTGTNLSRDTQKTVSGSFATCSASARRVKT